MTKTVSKLLAATLLALTVMVGLTASCINNGDKNNTVEAMAKRVWQFSLSHPDGFTVDIRTMEEPIEGIAVSYAATQGSRSRKSLAFVVAHALEHDGYVGGWLDPASGLHYFDSTRLFPEDRLDEALQFARENGQQAVYIISTGQEIRVDGRQMAA